MLNCFVFADDRADIARDRVVQHFHDVVVDVFAVQNHAAFFVDGLTLQIHDVVVFQDVFTHLEVAAFKTLLRGFDRIGQHFGVDRCIFVDAEGVHHAHDAFTAEQPHQVVFERDIESAFAGVALTCGTPTKLIINPAAFVSFGTDDE